MARDRKPPENFNRYRLLSIIGEGGMGKVYLALDTQVNRRVALKIPDFDLEDTEALERFYREARIAANVKHDYLCPVWDFGEFDGMLFLSMPFIEGVPLSSRIHADQPWPAALAADLVRKLALAVNAMHEAGIVHRDLKPSNVMLKPDGDPIIMDFGLAREVEDHRLTAPGYAVGTPVYMAPEQVRADPDEVGPASDQYALGVLLYQLVCGRPPFEGTPREVLGKILFEPPRPPSAVNPGVDADMDAVCLRALAKRSGDRYPTVSAFAAALILYRRAHSRPATPQTHPQILLGPESAASIPALASTPRILPPTEETELTCPRCGKVLKTRLGMLTRRLSCPVCLADLGDPERGKPEKPPDFLSQPHEPPNLVQREHQKYAVLTALGIILFALALGLAAMILQQL